MRVQGVLFIWLAAFPDAARAFAPHTYSSGRSTTKTFLIKEAVGRLVGRGRAKKVVQQPSPIRIGDALPVDVDVIVCGKTKATKEDDDEPESAVVNIRDVVGKGKALLIGTFFFIGTAAIFYILLFVVSLFGGTLQPRNAGSLYSHMYRKAPAWLCRTSLAIPPIGN
jgi:hypothetical protein